MKNKFKSYSFWMSLSASVVLVLNNIGKIFGFAINGDVATQIVDSICGVLIMLGVITMTKEEKTEESDKEEKDTKEEDDTEKEE